MYHTPRIRAMASVLSTLHLGLGLTGEPGTSSRSISAVCGLLPFWGECITLSKRAAGARLKIFLTTGTASSLLHKALVVYDVGYRS